MISQKEFLSILWIAKEGVGQHLFRSFLTALGLFFGVAAVIAMLSIGAGAKEELVSQIKSLGMNNIIIENSFSNSSGNGQKQKQSVGLTLLDAQKIKSSFPLLKVSSQTSFSSTAMINQKIINDMDMVGADPFFFPNPNFSLIGGRFFSQEEADLYKKVCLISQSSAKQYFPGLNPIGQYLKIDSEWFQIIGLFSAASFKETKVEEISIKDFNQITIIPINTYLKRVGNNINKQPIDRLIITVPNSEESFIYAKTLEKMLNRYHYQNQDFKIILPSELLARYRKTQTIFNIVMGTIASISLLVGGIGITNIMLANALERRKEIGVRRACGATKISILWQFLLEAILISISGGTMGILLGVILTYLISYYAQWQTSITLSSIFLAFMVSVAVGVVSGFLPAKKAAKMEPIEALRYE